METMDKNFKERVELYKFDALPGICHLKEALLPQLPQCSRRRTQM